jgi:hypothetical protein
MSHGVLPILDRLWDVTNPSKELMGREPFFSKGLRVQGEFNMNLGEEEPGEPVPRLNRHILGLWGQGTGRPDM